MTEDRIFCSEAVAGGDTCGGEVTCTLEGEFVVWDCSKDPAHTMSLHVRKADPGRRTGDRLARAGVPEAFFGHTFVRDANNKPAVDVVLAWLADFGPGERGLPAPALYGRTGVGKSHLLSSLCARLIHEHDVQVRFFTVRQLLHELQRFEDPEGREDLWREVTSVDVLALDDFGAQRDTEWRLDQLADLVDERYQRQLPILIATNYPVDHWESMADSRTVSRLKGMCLPIELKGPDRRWQEVA